MTVGFQPIVYREFYDLPRAVVVEIDGASFFLDCAFDSAIDEYPDRYRVYQIDVGLAEATSIKDWTNLQSRGEFIGQVPVDDVEFDPTGRSGISRGFLLHLRDPPAHDT